jgi:hypothetical protein
LNLGGFETGCKKQRQKCIPTNAYKEPRDHIRADHCLSQACLLKSESGDLCEVEIPNATEWITHLQNAHAEDLTKGIDCPVCAQRIDGGSSFIHIQNHFDVAFFHCSDIARAAWLDVDTLDTVHRLPPLSALRNSAIVQMPRTKRKRDVSPGRSLLVRTGFPSTPTVSAIDIAQISGKKLRMRSRPVFVK